MGLCLGKSASCWPDLPPELAGEILSKLLRHKDRVSFGAVCRSWRLAAQQQSSLLPSAMPWINLGRGWYQDLAGNGKVRRFATPRGRGYRARATFDNWVLYEHKRSYRCFLGDPLSPSTPAIEVPCHYERPCRHDVVHGEYDLFRAWSEPNPFTSWPLRKIIVCSSHLVVALFGHCELIKIGCFRPGTAKIQPAALSWSNPPYTSYQDPQGHGWKIMYEDIAFHRGKIFALSSKENLFTYDLVLGETPLSESCSRVEHVIKEGPAVAAMANTRYVQHQLVTSSDKQKLLMVRWGIPWQMDRVTFDHRMMALQVFEADLRKGRWSEVKDLGSQVLVIGQTSSRALVVAGSSDRRFRGNSVFLLGDTWSSAWFNATNHSWCNCADCQEQGYTVPSYCVYDMMRGEVSLVSLSGGRGPTKFPKMAWFFPSE